MKINWSSIPFCLIICRGLAILSAVWVVAYAQYSSKNKQAACFGRRHLMRVIIQQPAISPRLSSMNRQFDSSPEHWSFSLRLNAALRRPKHRLVGT